MPLRKTGETEKQFWRERNQNFSSRHANMTVLIQGNLCKVPHSVNIQVENQVDSWIFESENQGRVQRLRYKYKSYQYLLISQYLTGEGPEREQGQGPGKLQILVVQQSSLQKETSQGSWQKPGEWGCHGNQDKKVSKSSNTLALEVSPRCPIFKA